MAEKGHKDDKKNSSPKKSSGARKELPSTSNQSNTIKKNSSKENISANIKKPRAQSATSSTGRKTSSPKPSKTTRTSPKKKTNTALPVTEIRENRPARQKTADAKPKSQKRNVAVKATPKSKKAVENLKKRKSIPPVKKSPEEIEREKKRIELQREIERRKSGYMPVGDHLEELRWRIIRIVFWVFFFSIISFFFYKEIWEFVMGPILPLIENAEKQDNMVVKIITNKLTDFFIIQFKAVVMVGVIAAIPFILYEIWGFIVPALKRPSRLWGTLLLITSVALFWGGGLFARFGIWPLVTKFLIYDWMPPGMLLETGEISKIVQPEVHLTIGDYLSFFFSFHFAFGAVFELPVVSIILALIGILRSGFFTASWRFAVVIIAVASALITPPDPFSMIAIMIPLLILYTISGFIVYAIEKTKKDN